jgi:hypothetical protein
MSRYRASAIHLCICVVIALFFFALLWLVWYPWPLFEAVGGTEIFLLLLIVDVALGPLLTLIVYKPNKKTLKFDLTTIGVIQAVALFYGVFTLLAARPAYVAALGFRFEVVQANEIGPTALEASGQSLPLFGPKWVGIKPPNDSEARAKVTFSALNGADYGHFPEYHQPIENMRDEILKNARAIDELKKLNIGSRPSVDDWLLAHKLKAEDVKYQGLKSRVRDFTVILDAKTASVIEIAPFKPW